MSFILSIENSEQDWQLSGRGTEELLRILDGIYGEDELIEEVRIASYISGMELNMASQHDRAIATKILEGIKLISPNAVEKLLMDRFKELGALLTKALSGQP